MNVCLKFLFLLLIISNSFLSFSQCNGFYSYSLSSQNNNFCNTGTINVLYYHPYEIEFINLNGDTSLINSEDSIQNVNIIPINSSQTQIQINGLQSGVYEIILVDSSNCNNNIQVNSSEPVVTYSSVENISSCNSYYWNGNTYSESGTYFLDTLSLNGCDSLATLNLTINNSFLSTEYVTACDSFNWNGTSYTQSGIYEFDTVTVNGCDSIAELNLTINNTYTSTESITSCDSYDWNGQTYTQTGIYNYNSSTVNGCDSTAILDLIIFNSEFIQVDTIVCESFLFNSNIYSESGNYQTIYNSVNGCDSIVSLNLTIKNSSSSFENVSSCENYYWNGEIYSETGNYSFDTISAYGCDSIAILSLIINNNSSTFEDIISCDNYSWNGMTYTASGIYTYESINEYGCLNIDSINLTINHSTSNNEDVVACDIYYWNGEIYFESGVYTYESSNEWGCTNVSTLNLTIDSNSSSFIKYEENITACDLYTWIDGNTYYTSDTIIFTDYYADYWNLSNESITSWNQWGSNEVSSSDSTIIISGNGSSTLGARVYFDSINLIQPLSINNNYILEAKVKVSSNSSVGLSINDGINSNLDSSIFISSTEYSLISIPFIAYSQEEAYFYINSLNNDEVVFISDIELYQVDNNYPLYCDSLVVLNLTINNSSVFHEDTIVCDSYNWLGNTYTESGTYNIQTTTINGCDSIATLNLIVNSSSSSFDTIITCDSYEWNGEIYTESGTYSYDTYNYSEENDNEFSMSFDGVDDYIDILPTDNFIFNNGLNISFWAYTLRDFDSESFIYLRNNSLSNTPIIYIRHSEYDLNKDFVNIRGTEDQFYTQVYFPENEWFHFSLNIDRISSSQDLISIYLNGDPLLETEVSTLGILDFTDIYSSESGIQIGSAPHEEWDNFKGFIDNIQIWKKSLNTTQINNYMNCPPIGNEDSLVSYWSFEEGENNTVGSLSENENNGNINGAFYINDTHNQSCQLTTINGCDTSAVLNLTINNSFINNEYVNSCDSYEWNGSMYTESGIYEFNTVTSKGCDSTIFLNLSINYSQLIYDSVLACNEYTWINGVTYNSSDSASYINYHADYWNLSNESTSSWINWGTNEIFSSDSAIIIYGDGSASGLGARIYFDSTNLIQPLSINNNYILEAKVKVS